MTGNGRTVLFIGGTGTISASCVQRAVAVGLDVSVLNRGRTAARRPLPDEVSVLSADIHDLGATRAAMGRRDFDVVVNFLTFTQKEAAESVELFRERTAQYVHISTAMVYQKPVVVVPYVESTPRRNPFSTYAVEKIAVEVFFEELYRSTAFPVTVVRPSHTYDAAHPPFPGDWTVVDRICRGAEIVVPGDGTSLWTLTHAADFAVGLVGLLGNPLAIGESFHITSDDVYSWNQIYGIVAAAAGMTPRLVHVPSEFLPIAASDWGWSAGIVGDLQHSALFDNSKIRRFVPEFAPRVVFHRAVRDILRWRDEHPKEAQRQPEVEAIMDRLVRGYHESARVFAALSPADSGAGFASSI